MLERSSDPRDQQIGGLGPNHAIMPPLEQLDFEQLLEPG
jgi:hypothetical protein